MGAPTLREDPLWERRPFELEFDDFELIRDKLPRRKHFLPVISMMAALTMPLVGIGHMTGKALVSRKLLFNIFAGFQLPNCGLQNNSILRPRRLDELDFPATLRGHVLVVLRVLDDRAQ